MAEKGDADLSSRAVLDKPTGELIDLQDGDRILRKASVDYLKEHQEWRIEHFYKGNIDELRGQLLSLSINEKAFLLSIATYIGYTDCCLKYDNGNTLDVDDLIRLCGMKKSLLYATVESLRKKDIIYKGKNSKGMQYFVNPWLFCKGNRINRVLKTMFRNYKIKVLGEKRWEEVLD